MDKLFLISHFKNQSATARALGVSSAAMAQIGDGQLPDSTTGKVARLCPEIWLDWLQESQPWLLQAWLRRQKKSRSKEKS